MYRGWRTEPNGLIVVTLADGSEKTPTIVRLDHVAILRRIQTTGTFRGRAFPLGELSQRVADKWGVPVEWLRAMQFQESGGNPYARNPEKLPGIEDDGVGELQITSAWLKRGFTDEQLEDPETNLTIGARHIVQSLVPTYGHDFPKISAAFNAGSVHHPYKGYENEWNMHCTLGHIDAEVSALNWQILDLMEEAERAQAHQFGTLDLLGPPPPAIDNDEPPATDRNA